MAEETPAPEGEALPEDTAAPAPAAKRRPARAWGWVLLALCAGLVAAQVAGLLLRDRLERRVTPLARAPAPEPGAHPEASTTGPAAEPAPLFGPEVREVAVAGPGASAPPPPAEPGPGASAKPPPAAAPAIPAAVTPTAAKPTPAATRALLVDVYLSQRYLLEAEARLTSLGLPHLRTEFERKGRGYRVAVAAADEAQAKAARQVLDRGGLVCRPAGEGLEVFVYYRDEAQSIVDSLGQAGVRAALSSVEGRRPFWRLYAGPFPPDEARRVQKVLRAQGIRTTLEVKP
ncbi:MAG: SPOR domain-containing protein [Deltaproteobacteria bacterium]|nr:SPOR domain-containing protein [Deltaproteobacteria bacterium]